VYFEVFVKELKFYVVSHNYYDKDWQKAEEYCRSTVDTCIKDYNKAFLNIFKKELPDVDFT
jgi:hypothetical protein